MIFLRRENRKKMEKLIKDQSKLLKDAAKYRDQINLKLNFDSLDTDSDKTINTSG